MVPAPPHQPSSTTQYPMVIPERTHREYSRSTRTTISVPIPVPVPVPPSVGHEHEHVFKPTDIPVGYLFEPTDEEIILCYLNKKIAEPNFQVFYIQEVDLYEFHPREIIKGCTTKDHYFFTQRKRMHQGGSRASRQTKDGSTWKATSKVQTIMDSTKSYKIGSKATLAYVEKKAGGGIKDQTKTNRWIMHEFQTAQETTTTGMKLSDWVICRIYEKKKKAAHDKEDDDKDLSIEEEEDDDDEGDEYECLLENYLSMDVEEDCEVGEMQGEENIGTDHDQGIDNSMDEDFAKFLETYVSFDVEEEGEVMNSSVEGCIRESRENEVHEGKEIEEDLNQVLMSDFMDGGGPLLYNSMDGVQGGENNSMEGDEEFSKLLENILSTDVEEEYYELGGERKEKEKEKLYLDVGDIIDGDLSNRFLLKENTNFPSTSQQIPYQHNYSYHHFPAASFNHSNTFTYGTDDMSFNFMMHPHSTNLTPLPESFTNGGCSSSHTELLPLPDSFTNGGCSSSGTELLPLPDSFTNGGCSSSHIPLPDSFKWSW